MSSQSYVLGYPLYAVEGCGDDRVLLGGGGGTLKSGVRNELGCYSVAGNGMTAPRSTLPTKDAVTAMSLSEKDGWIATVIGEEVRTFTYRNTLLTSIVPMDEGLPKGESAPSTVKFSAKGSRLVVGFEDGSVRVYNFPSFSEICSFSGHSHGVVEVDTSESGKLAVSTSKSTCFVWDASSGQSAFEIKTKAKKAHIRSVAFTKSGEPAPVSFVVTVENENKVGGFVSTWNESGEKKFFVKVMKEQITAMTISESNLVACGGSEGNVSVLRMDTSGQLSHCYRTRSPFHILAVTSLSFTTPSRDLVSVSADSTMKCYAAKAVESEPAFNLVVLLLMLLLLISFVLGIYIPYAQHASQNP
ncbi:hypothetical protein NDN08_003816 [Rhodosorus marinus]|uniref:Uncharacterized protein n=1 Tax=Rhodosorus marinus TaxID=101924 RepID=A0AAV8UGJ1_9RHOD|nr:hypothetical protein NDN08_003816 [Rhodosorus marinus]